jgi:hypothetical protein
MFYLKTGTSFVEILGFGFESNYRITTEEQATPLLTRDQAESHQAQMFRKSGVKCEIVEK